MNIPAEGYNSYGVFLQDKFGHRVHKIPINAGFTCPNRDGTVAQGGCSYCNIDSFTPETARVRIPIIRQVEDSIAYLKERFKAKAFIAYFQPYSNTYASVERLQELYEQALQHPEVIGISIGSRPDCLDNDKLCYLQQLARDYFVTLELGIESANDETLRLVNRGHDFRCTAEAFSKATGRGIYLCGHVIYGLPNENKAEMLRTTRVVSGLPLDFIKLHNLHVVRHTELAKQFSEKPFPVFHFDEWVEFVCNILQHLNPNFKIERLYGDAPKELLVAPMWCKEKSAAQVIYAIQQKLITLAAYQGQYFGKPHALESQTAIANEEPYNG